MNTKAMVVHSRDIEPASLTSRFSLALTARTEYALMLLLMTAEMWNSEDLSTHRRNASNLAWQCGYRFGHEPMPSFFADCDELQECWEYGAEDKEDERVAAETEAENMRRAARVELLIQARDWNALHLPEPEEVLALLLAGESCLVAGHRLSPEGDLNIVWFTNAYGHDGAFANIDELDLASVSEFLCDMARGKEYGPVPH